jgi:hypothetical protein
MTTTALQNKIALLDATTKILEALASWQTPQVLLPFRAESIEEQQLKEAQRGIERAVEKQQELETLSTLKKEWSNW